MPEPADNAKRAKTEISAEAYNKVVESASLEDIKLISSSFYVQPSFFEMRENVALSIDKQCTDCTEVENGTIVAFFTFEVKGRIKDHEDNDGEVMEASAVYLAAYNVDPDSQTSEAAAFCKRVGLFAAYPYFRSLVSHWSADADLGLPPLPLITAPPRKGAPSAKEPEKTKTILAKKKSKRQKIK